MAELIEEQRVYNKESKRQIDLTPVQVKSEDIKEKVLKMGKNVGESILNSYIGFLSVTKNFTKLDSRLTAIAIIIMSRYDNNPTIENIETVLDELKRLAYGKTDGNEMKFEKLRQQTSRILYRYIKYVKNSLK